MYSRISEDNPYIPSSGGASGAWVGIQPNGVGLLQAGWFNIGSFPGPSAGGCSPGFAQYELSNENYSALYLTGSCLTSSNEPEVYLQNASWSGNTITSGQWERMFNVLPLATVSVSSGWSPQGNSEARTLRAPGVENSYKTNPVECTSVSYLNGNSGSWIPPSIDAYLDTASW